MSRVGWFGLFTLVMAAACGPSDEIVQGRVDQAVAFKEWSWIQATVNKGQLTLEGLAPDEEALAEVGPLLAQVQGVKDVVNNVALDTALVRRRGQAAECAQAVEGILTQRAIRFGSGNARPQAASARTLDEIAQVLAGCPDATFRVTGTVAEGGTANESLSQRRTQAVVDHLAGKGVAAGRLSAAPAGGSVIGIVLASH